jgi:hypothetical protein
LDPIGELVLVGDTLPVQAGRPRRRGPDWTSNWSFNILDTVTDNRMTAGGWRNRFVSMLPTVSR